MELGPEYPRLCANGLNELTDDNALGRGVLFNGLSAILRCWMPLVAVIVLVLAAPVGVAPLLSARGFDATEDTSEDTAKEEPAIEGKEAALNGVLMQLADRGC